MLKRTIVGIIGALLVCLAIFFNQTYPIILNIIIAIACVMSMYELLSAMGILRVHFLTIPTFLFTAIVPIVSKHFDFQFSWYIYSLLIFCVMLFFKDKISFKEVASVYTMALVITFFLNSLLIARDRAGRCGTFYVVLTLAIAWLTDTGAYFCGSFWGKRKLCPSISPKKTVEGAIGGVIVSLASVFALSFVYKNFIFIEPIYIDYCILAISGVLGSVISMIGDLSFSLVKRDCHIKDFGNVIPGHGGMLDRIDSVIFISPFICFLSVIFPIVQAV